MGSDLASVLKDRPHTPTETHSFQWGSVQLQESVCEHLTTVLGLYWATTFYPSRRLQLVFCDECIVVIQPGGDEHLDNPGVGTLYLTGKVATSLSSRDEQSIGHK